MIRLLSFYALLLVIMSSSCSVHEDYGAHGRDGEVFFGIDYHFAAPYSYWDDNPSLPENPFLGEFYLSYPGTYEFEYFVNAHDYWYGTYTLFQNYGTEGGPYGEAGLDGLDTFLMMYCDPNGWHEDRFEYKNLVEVERLKDKVEITSNQGSMRYSIEMTKTDVLSRPTKNKPKLGS